MTQIKIFLILTTIFGVITAQEVEIKTFKIKYISASHIYLQGGEKDGLAVGDELIVYSGSEKIGRIKIEFVSRYSASASVLEKQRDFKIGDIAKLVKEEKAAETAISSQKTDSLISERKMPPYQRKRTAPRALKTKIDGYVSGQYYYFKDLGARKLNFSQPTMRLRLKIKNLWNRHYNFELRFRSRYNLRDKSFSANVPKSEWQNRLYEFTFDYNAPGAFLTYKLGRIISNAFSGVGYIDGALANLKLTNDFYFGLFAGTQPDWRTSNFQTEIQKYGGYLKFERGKFGSKKINVTLAGVGEYHGGTVSREFMYFQVSYYHGRRWNIYHNVEIDVNRYWRKERAKESLSLTGFYLNANYRITSSISASLSYDNRKNYYTYELRTLADSLFDDAFRHGLRANVYFKIFKDYQISLNFGLREKSTDANFSYSYGLNVTRRNFFSKYNRMSFRFSGFDNIFATGFSPNATFSRYLRGGHYLTFSYGNYYYQIKNINDNKLNHWIRILGQIELPARFYINSTYEYDWGSDVKGHRLLFELGYRF
ncbi:hypothetical protein [Caldithrix abyssi]